VLFQSQLKAKSSELEASLKSIKELEAKVDRLEKTLAESKATEAKLRAQVGPVQGLGFMSVSKGAERGQTRGAGWSSLVALSISILWYWVMCHSLFPS
jgi:hypothetical protein